MCVIFTLCYQGVNQIFNLLYYLYIHISCCFFRIPLAKGTGQKAIYKYLLAWGKNNLITPKIFGTPRPCLMLLRESNTHDIIWMDEKQGFISRRLIYIALHSLQMSALKNMKVHWHAKRSSVRALRLIQKWEMRIKCQQRGPALLSVLYISTQLCAPLSSTDS